MTIKSLKGWSQFGMNFVITNGEDFINLEEENISEFIEENKDVKISKIEDKKDYLLIYCN